MTAFDYAVLAVLGFSLVVGVLRGLVRELLMLGGWVAAFLLSTAFARDLANLLPANLGPLLAQLIAWLAIFTGTLIVAGFAGLVLSLVTRSAGLAFTDRALGALFGLGRGILVTLAIVFLGGLTSLPREPFWRDSKLAGPFETAIVALRPFLPGELGRQIRYR
ncbi:MAG: CvpA family protein [Burkholderiales bacterium]|nr:CvpA family protein [Burkholderiales bacterium]